MTSISPNIDVNNMIAEINSIYSHSFKKFFHIDPHRYINVDDLMCDLYNTIPMWDSHASVSRKNSFKDETDYRINTHNNGYIYVSKNAKLDNIYRIYNEFIEKDVKHITINLTSLLDPYTVENAKMFFNIVYPFIYDEQTLKTGPGGSHGDFNIFRYDPKTGDGIIQNEVINTSLKVRMRLPKIKLNILLSGEYGLFWGSRLQSASNVTLHIYNTDITYTNVFSIQFRYENAFVRGNILISDFPIRYKIKGPTLDKKFLPYV